MLPRQPLSGLKLVDSQYLLGFFDAVFDKEPLSLHVRQGLVCVLFQVGIGERIFYLNSVLC